MAETDDIKADTAAKAAESGETTDEQLWDEIAAEDTGAGEEDAPDIEADADKNDPDPGPSDEDDDAGKRQDEEPDNIDPKVLDAQLKRLQHKLDSEKGRTAASRRQIDSLNAQIATAQKAQGEKRDDAALAARKAKIAEAREEYGDVVGPLADHIADLESRLDDLNKRESDDLRRAKDEYTNLVMAQQEVFLGEHPDGFETITKNREAFTRWIDDQPKAMREAYQANKQAIVDGNQAALLVGRFKQALLGADGRDVPQTRDEPRLQSRRQQQLAGARSLKSSGQQKAASRPDKDADDPEAHWDYFKRQDERQAARR